MSVLKIKDAEGNWQSIPALRGEKGETGAQGPAGPTGPAPDMSIYYTKTEIDTKGYQTEAEVTALINNAIGNIENGTY